MNVKGKSMSDISLVNVSKTYKNGYSAVKNFNLDIREGELAEFRIKDLALNRKYSVIYHKNKFLPRSARTLMELCKEGNGADRI